MLRCIKDLDADNSVIFPNIQDDVLGTALVQHLQPSQKFYRAYLAGKMGDEEKVMEWAGEWETYQELTKAIELLKETEVC